MSKSEYSIQTSKNSKSDISFREFNKIVPPSLGFSWIKQRENIFIIQNVTIHRSQFEKMPTLSTHENIKMMVKLSTAENRSLLVLNTLTSSKNPFILNREKKQSKRNNEEKSFQFLRIFEKYTSKSWHGGAAAAVVVVVVVVVAAEGICFEPVDSRLHRGVHDRCPPNHELRPGGAVIIQTTSHFYHLVPRTSESRNANYTPEGAEVRALSWGPDF